MNDKNKKKGRFIGFEINTNEGTIKTHSIVGYRREKKPGFNLKNVTRFSNTNVSGLGYNLAKFTNLFAIDTNTKQLNERSKLNVGAVCELDNNGATFLFHLADYGTVEKPEKRNWIKLIEFIQKLPRYNSNLFIGIIVDSDLGNLDAHNNRTLPILGDYYLPNNFEFIYASADKKDTILNEAIRFCDSTANAIFEKLKKINLGDHIKILKIGQSFNRSPLSNNFNSGATI